MHTGKNAIWVTAFISLLLINVIVVMVSMTFRQPDDIPQEDGTLMKASDEVQLEWWPGLVKPEGPSALMQPAGVGRRAGVSITPVNGGGSVMETPEYPELMAGYVSELSKYLIDYFHITPHRMEVPGSDRDED